MNWRRCGRGARWVASLSATWAMAACDAPSCGSTRTSDAPTVPSSSAKEHPATPPPSAPKVPVLTYVPGSSTKLQQLIGEEDKERHVSTLSRTFSRFGVRGTDLGFSFEHRGLVYFLFGDTVGTQGRALDTIATTGSRDPEAGVKLDFLMEGEKYLTVQPPGLSMSAFEVPVSGIDLGGKMYVVVRTGHADDWSTDRTMLTRFVPPSSFEVVRKMSPRFITMSMHLQPPAGGAALPPGGPYVYVWATARYRQSDVYFFAIPEAHFETGEGTVYYTGTDGAGAPQWSSREADAAPVVKDGQIGDVSVTWCKELGLWIMTYDHRSPQGIFLHDARTPWGPWSERQHIFQGHEATAFIHDPARVPDDGLGGPTIGKSDPHTTHGGMYAPYVVERWTSVHGSELDLYYTLSTWNPYVIVLMRSKLRIE